MAVLSGFSGPTRGIPTRGRSSKFLAPWPAVAPFLVRRTCMLACKKERSWELVGRVPEPKRRSSGPELEKPRSSALPCVPWLAGLWTCFGIKNRRTMIRSSSGLKYLRGATKVDPEPGRRHSHLARTQFYCFSSEGGAMIRGNFHPIDSPLFLNQLDQGFA